MPYKFPTDATAAPGPLPASSATALSVLAGSCAKRILEGSTEDETTLHRLAFAFSATPDPVVAGILKASGLNGTETPIKTTDEWEAFSRAFGALPAPRGSDAAASGVAYEEATVRRELAGKLLTKMSDRLGSLSIFVTMAPTLAIDVLIAADPAIMDAIPKARLMIWWGRCSRRLFLKTVWPNPAPTFASGTIATVCALEKYAERRAPR